MMNLVEELKALQDSEKLADSGLRSKEEPNQVELEKVIKETMEIMRPVQSLAMFYMTLVQSGKEPVYYGQSVGPDDTDAVLLWWKVSDDQYRVIFGDLTAENITAEELAELEKLFSE
jgi:cAMP phosphodiesterase